MNDMQICIAFQVCIIIWFICAMLWAHSVHKWMKGVNTTLNAHRKLIESLKWDK